MLAARQGRKRPFGPQRPSALLSALLVAAACRRGAVPSPAPESAGRQTATVPARVSDDAIRVAAGDANTCVIREGGSIWCWGSFDTKTAADIDPVKRVRPPHSIAGVPPAREIALADDACAITVDGKVYCGWLHGEPRAVAGVSGATALVMDPLQACAVLADGGVACWRSPARPSVRRGRDDAAEQTPATRVDGLDGAHLFAASVADQCIVTRDRSRVQCQSPFAPLVAGVTWLLERPRVDAIAASIYEVCVGSGSEIVCTPSWRAAGKPQPRSIAGLGRIVQLGVNESSLCGRNAQGQVFCYEGKRTSPETASERLRAAARVESLIVVDVPPSIDLSVGALHSCSVSTAGEVHCWGSGGGVSGKPTSYIAPTPLQLDRFDELALDGDQTCALVDGRVLCADKHRACSTGRFEQRTASAWTSRSDLGKWTHLHVVGSYYGSCVASRRVGPPRGSAANGPRAQPAGDRADFLTCFGTSAKREVLLRLPDGTWDRTAQVVLDVGFGCIRSHDGGVECFELPALEDRHISPAHPEVTLDIDPPPVALVPVGMLPPATRLTADSDTLCTTSAAGEVHCWRGAARPRPQPPLLTGVSAFAMGDVAACAIDRRGDVRCRYGGGDFEPVVGIQRARSLVAGRGHLCALDELGRVYCWGLDDRDVLREVREPGGEPTTRKAASLIDLPGETRELFGGPYQTCARLVRGPVMCWGANFGGGLGVGVPTCVEQPVRVPLDPPPATARPRE